MPKKKYLMVVLALIFAVMQILPAFANELDDKQAEYDDVQQKMQQMEIAKERARREAEEASDRMEEIVAVCRLRSRRSKRSVINCSR